MKQIHPLVNESNERRRSTQTIGPVRPLALIMLTVLTGLMAYEWLKQLIFPGITVWQSRAITVIFSSIVATVAAHFALRKHESLSQQLIKDITGHKRLEESLRESEEKYRNLVERAHDGIVIIQDGLIKYANPRVAQMSGYTVEELTGTPFINYLHPDEHAILIERYRRRMAGENVPPIYETVVTHSNGRKIYVEINAGVIPYQGKPADLVIVRDITGRKQAEEALRRRNEALIALNAIVTTIGQSLDLAHLLKATLDKVLEMIKLEAGWIQLLDRSQDEDSLSLAAQQGFSQEMAQAAQTIPLSGSLAGQVIQSGRPVVVAGGRDESRVRIETARQEELPALALIPIQARDEILGVLGVFSPSPRELDSQEMQLLTATGFQLGVAIENMRLAREAAELNVLRELDRLRSELIANISHELRTPLGLIKVFCSTLLREDVAIDRETQQEFLHNINEATDRLEYIVNNLLDLSRLEAGRLHLDKRPTDMGQLARKVMQAIEVHLAQHRLVYDFPARPLVATVDRVRIEQVLHNLLGNAVKYSPEGGVITIKGRRNKGQLLVQVSDQGIGISPAELERVFERFYRVENETTQKVGGVGLGLSVCQGIIEAHGGRIWVESRPGVGSTFHLTLPLGVPSESPSDQSQPP